MNLERLEELKERFCYIQADQTQINTEKRWDSSLAKNERMFNRLETHIIHRKISDSSI